MRSMLLLLLVIVGCSSGEEKVVIEVKGDDATKALVEAGIAEARQAAQYMEQANDEMERLFAEMDVADKRGWTEAETRGKAEAGRLWGDYNRNDNAKVFVEAVRGKSLADLGK
jgi:hypothetical protein